MQKAEKMKMESADLTSENIEKIASLFPQVITEARDEHGKLKKAVNFDLLKQLLSRDAADGDEAYAFTWVGKKAAIVEAGRPIRKTLRPCLEESKNWDTTENLYIEGDNLDVLKLLQENYLGKVKMIYIDPPYNTGHDFVYPDSFIMDNDEYNDGTGYFDEDGNVNFKRENSSSAGRYHSDWCSMMYSRLMLARNLLSDDGVIFISIDDNEQDNLRKICDEVFGRHNFVDNLIWKKRYGGGSKEKYFVSLHEYVLVYCNNIDNLNDIFIPLSSKSIERYYSKKDAKFNERGGYRTHPLEAGKAMDSRSNLIFPIIAPDGTKIMPKKQWLWSKERVQNAIENDEIEFFKGKDGWVVSSKQYLKEEDGKIRPAKMLSIIDDIYTQHGTNEMITLMGNAKIFQYPKPSEFVKKLISAITESKDEYILDFFSGSATTAHAVMQINAEDGGKRKFIMVQLQEPCPENSEAYKAGYKNICEIGKERIRRAGEKIRQEQQGKLTGNVPDTGFRVFKLDDSNMKDVYYSAKEYDQGLLDNVVSNIKADRNDLDLLYGCVVDWGLSLSLPHRKEEINGFPVYFYNDTELAACFKTGITEDTIKEIAARKPARIVLRDSCFARAQDRINAEEIVKDISPNTKVRVL